MGDQPGLSPDHFEILAVRELRKAGLQVSELRSHRRLTLPEPEGGYLLELRGAVSRPSWRRRVLIACRRQATAIGRAEIESLRAHLPEAGAEAGILFAMAPFEVEALDAASGCGLALLRVTDGRTGFDPGGWGARGLYPAWLPAYCAQAVDRDPQGQPRYQLLETGHGELLVQQLEHAGHAHSPRAQPGEEPAEGSPR